MVFLLLALLLGLAISITLAFKSLVAYRIPNGMLRIITLGLFSLFKLAGGALGILWLLSNHFLSHPNPTSRQQIDNTFYFTQQESFRVLNENGTLIQLTYDLAFYRSQPLWLDTALGKVYLKCSNPKSIKATIMQGKRLLVKADNVTAIDTTLDFGKPFTFCHSLLK